MTMEILILVSSPEHELHPPVAVMTTTTMETWLAWLWEPWKKWVRSSHHPGSTYLIRSQCPCCDGLSPGSWKDASLYWDLVSGMWTAAAALPAVDDDSVVVDHSMLFSRLPPQELSRFWERVAARTADRVAWNTSPQELPSTLTDDKTWVEVMRRGMLILWDYAFLESEDAFLHNMTVNPDRSVVSMYDVEWLVVKWIKGLASYDDDISIVVPAYPSDELNRPLPPWLVRRVFRRYTKCFNTTASSRMFLEPLRLLVEDEDGYEILCAVFDLLRMPKSKYLECLYQKSRALSTTHEEVALFLWESNYTVLTFPAGGPPPKMYPTVLLSAWLGRTMMWIGDPFLNHVHLIGEGLWTLCVYSSSSAKTFMGEYVLTEEERSTTFATVLETLHRDAHRPMNWNLTSKSFSDRKKKHVNPYRQLRREAETRWSDVLQALVTPPPGVPVLDKNAEYLQSYNWIDAKHIQDHIHPTCADSTRAALSALHGHFYQLGRRNLFLLSSSTLAFEDSQIKCLDHLSQFDLQRAYPELHS